VEQPEQGYGAAGQRPVAWAPPTAIDDSWPAPAAPAPAPAQAPPALLPPPPRSHWAPVPVRQRRPLSAPPVDGRRPPFWLFVIVIIAFEVPNVLYAIRGLPHVDLNADLFGQLMRNELIALAVLMVLVLVGRYPRAVGWLPRRSTARAVPAIALAMVLTAVALIAVASVHLSWSASRTTILVVNVLAVGVVEETIFRGLLWSSLPRTWSASRVLLVTSLLFGSWHILNGLVTGNWRAAFIQAAIVSVVGLGLGAVRLRTGWLGLPVLLHAAVDGGIVAAQLVIGADGRHLPGAIILPLLAFEVLYVTVAITGIVVLIRTFRAERRERAEALTPPAPPVPSEAPPWPPSAAPVPATVMPPGRRH